MLTHLRIVDFGIIEAVDLPLASGLNVLTGETGAGKSMIVGAAGLLRGGRASSEIVRKGAKEAVVEALFDLRELPVQRALLGELGLPEDGDELLVRRVIARQGRGKIWVNGSICTAAVLGRVTEGLLDISGQHEYQSLSDRQRQLTLLDALAVSAEERQAMAEACERIEGLAASLEGTRIDDRQRVERSDFLRFQLNEVERAELVAGEDERLGAEVAKLHRASELCDVASSAEATLYSSDGSLCERLASLQRRVADLVGVDSALEPYAAQLDEARLVLEDVALSLGRYGEGVDLDPARLGEVEERLDLIHRLRRKHGASVEEIIARGEAMRRELDELDSLDSRREELEAELESARSAAAEVAAKLSAARTKVARRLSKQIGERLAELSMKDARFTVAVGPRPAQKGDPEGLLYKDKGQDARRLTASGWDRVEFEVATNAGEDPRPIGKIASGGELSRLMLALRQVLGEHQAAGTSVFDEVDAGIGGATADVVGRSLAAVGAHRQVLVVTHQPQVAAYAHRHFHVGKGRSGARTVSAVRTLEDEVRLEELARMLAGSEVTEAARENARGLLEAAASLERPKKISSRAKKARGKKARAAG